MATSNVPWMTGMSCCSADWRESWAIPGRLKIFSVTTAPPSIRGTLMPRTESAGPAALRSTCPNSTRRAEKPRICAPVT